MNGYLLDLGRMEYGEALGLQKELAARRAKGEIPDSLILVEHDHVITLGRKTTPANFKPQNIPVFRVERGGDATYHGPGQLVGYPIIKMLEPDVRGFVRRLEQVIILAAKDFRIEAGVREKNTGVWVG